MAHFKRWLDHVGGLLFLALFVVFILQIGARFLWNQPLPWTDELAVVLYLWVIFWACAFMVPASSHVSVDILIQHLPAALRIWFQTAGQLMLGGLALWALPASWDYVWFMRREATAVMGLPLFWVFLPLLVALLMMVIKTLHSVWQLLHSMRKSA
ncbi:MAG: TRAP transporter small permease subunit [Burkholderiales bacterium]|jgi:TRAP-type C4-dicarboxylate transport system permease small subunit|nr:TRAP transporter small permease subunit [Burkholderiales bacterium]